MAKLSEVPTGSKIILVDIPAPEELYKFLMAYGIFRGTEVNILRNDRWQDMILAEVKGKRIAIRKKDVAAIEVAII